MAASNVKNYRSSRKGWIAVLLLALIIVLLVGLWFRNEHENTYTFPRDLSKIAYGVNVDISAMIAGSGYTVRAANGGDFFDLAAQLGINTLRITDVRWTNSGKMRSRGVWNAVFQEAASHHINIILLLTDSNHRSALAEAHILLGDYGLAHAPALWMVDLSNEPDVSDAQEMDELRAEAAYVRRVAPKVPVTIGGWKSEIAGQPGKFDWQDPADIPSLIDLVDVVSPHLYGFEQDAARGISPAESTRDFLSAVRQQAQRKPILLEEFGAGNGLATTTQAVPTGSPSWQASVYRGVLQEVTAEHSQGVIGAVAWIIAPRPAPSDASGYQGDMAGWAFVLDHGQQLLPAAQTFSAIEQSQENNRLQENSSP